MVLSWCRVRTGKQITAENSLQLAQGFIKSSFFSILFIALNSYVVLTFNTVTVRRTLLFTTFIFTHRRAVVNKEKPPRVVEGPLLFIPCENCEQKTTPQVFIKLFDTLSWWEYFCPPLWLRHPCTEGESKMHFS